MSGDATEAMVAKGIGVGSEESFDLLVGAGCTVEVGSGYWTVSATVGTGDASGDFAAHWVRTRVAQIRTVSSVKLRNGSIRQANSFSER